MSVTAATKRGISGLLKDAEFGTPVVVERHGRPVAAIVSMRHLHEFAEFEADLRSAAFALERTARDDGQRTDLDEVINIPRVQPCGTRIRAGCRTTCRALIVACRRHRADSH